MPMSLLTDRISWMIADYLPALLTRMDGFPHRSRTACAASRIDSGEVTSQ